jgi:hypothetical protein
LKGVATALEGPSEADRAAIAARADEAFAISRSAKAKLKDFRDNPTGLSSIEEDAEVAAFLRQQFNTGTSLPKLRAGCIEKFGEDRSPSEGRIGVFRQRWRQAWRTRRTRA